jgi:hypothetical protein
VWDIYSVRHEAGRKAAICRQGSCDLNFAPVPTEEVPGSLSSVGAFGAQEEDEGREMSSVKHQKWTLLTLSSSYEGKYAAFVFLSLAYFT